MKQMRMVFVLAAGLFAIPAYAAGAGVGVGVAPAGGNDFEKNETAAAAHCKAFAEAEEIYHRTDYMGEGVLQYAQVLNGRAEEPKRAGAEPAKLEKPSEAEKAQIAKLIKGLANDEFAAREKAQEDLLALGSKALEQATAAANAGADAEVAQRCKKIADTINESLTPGPKLKLKWRFGLIGSKGQDELALIDRTFAAAECPAGCDPAQSKPTGGYLFRVLTQQGSAATGGKRDYIVGQGKTMTLGYAMLAFPAEYGVTGKHCIIINNNGTLFERDFGSKKDTDEYVKNCIEYDPTKEWVPVQ